MKTLYFNRQTLKGVNANEICYPLTIEVDSSFNLTKTCPVFKGIVQKTNSEGEKLYHKEVYRQETEEVFIGYDETLEVTEKPCTVEVHKEDKEGNKLYTENIYDEEGEIVDTMTTTKTHNENGEANLPIFEEIQKESDSGNLIYLKPIYDTLIHNILDHIAEVTEETENPVMIEHYEEEEVNILSNPNYFTIDEVLQILFTSKLETSQEDNIIADMFISEEDLELNSCNANLGVGIAQLPSKGYITTKPISLEGSTRVFKLDLSTVPEGISVYINTKKFVEGVAELTNPTSTVKIKFLNTTDKPVDLKYYTIFYTKEVV